MRLISKERLRQQMDMVGWGYGKLAYNAHVSKGFISHLCTGRQSTCTPATAERIAEALKVHVELLFVPSVSTDKGRIAPSSPTKRERVAA